MKKEIRHYLLILFLSACPVFPQSTPSDDSFDEANLVHLGDVIEVDVLGSFEFDWRGGVNPEGFLDGMDKIESPVYALCRSEGEIAAAVEKEYSKILRDPKVRVRILDRSNRAVAYLDGAVRTPYRFQIKRSVRLNELIVLSGGITDKASGVITIFRPQSLNCNSRRGAAADEFVKASSSPGSETFSIKISDLIRGVKAANPEILSGDIVNVAEAFPIYIIGGVNAPGQISSRVQTTLTRAIASAGGVASDGDRSKVTIFRRSGSAQEIIERDLGTIRAGRASDPNLKPYDIVEVAQKGRPKRRFPPVVSGDPSGRLAKLPLRIVE